MTMTTTVPIPIYMNVSFRFDQSAAPRRVTQTGTDPR
jgi:hypothetical protein